MLALVFDTETTGLIESRSLALGKQPEIIELCAMLVDLRSAEVVAEVDSLLKPNGTISEEITKITGIRPEMVESSPKFVEILPRFRELLARADVVVAHNLTFDVDMVEVECERLQEAITWPRKVCTVEQTVHLRGYRLSLGALHEELLGAPFGGAHRARVDVEALVRCCVELAKRDEI